MRLGGLRSQSGRSGEKKIFLPATAFEPRTHLSKYRLSYPGSQGHKIYTNLRRHSFNANKTTSKIALFLHIILTLRLLKVIYRVSQEECARLQEGVPYVKVYRYNPKHLCPKLNGYGDNGQRSLKL